MWLILKVFVDFPELADKFISEKDTFDDKTQFALKAS